MKLVLSSTKLTDNKRPSKGDSLILKSAERKGLDTIVLDPSMITYHFASGDLRVNYQGRDISDSDIVIIRRTRGAELESYQLATAMESRGKVVVDPSASLIYPVSKFPSQVLRASEYTPKTIFASGLSEQTLEEITTNLTFPMIIKPNDGTKKRGFKVVANEQEVRDYFNENQHSWAIFQEYLDIVTSIRVLTIGGKVAGHSFCYGTKNFTGSYVAEKIAQKVIMNNPAKILGTDVVITRKGDYYVLECNRNPDFTPMETKDNYYADRIVDYLISLRNDTGHGKNNYESPKKKPDGILSRFLSSVSN